MTLVATINIIIVKLQSHVQTSVLGLGVDFGNFPQTPIQLLLNTLEPHLKLQSFLKIP